MNRAVFSTHFLTRGELDAPENGIVFSPSEGARFDFENDGFLKVSEVASQFDFDLDLLILAGCNSASDTWHNSSILSGFARPFFAAGVRNLVISHFPVRDDKSIHLTSPIIAARTGYAKVLQASMISAIERPNSTPRDWAWAMYVGR